MNKIICSLLDWYQIQISSHDRQTWEKSLDSQSFKNNLYCLSKKKSTKIDDLIDIDLIKGSSFAKTKSKLNLINLIFNGFKRVLFLPIYLKWWKFQTNGPFSFLILAVYLLQLTNLFIYNNINLFLLNDDKQFITLGYIITPSIIILILGILFSYITSAHPNTSCEIEKSKNTNMNQKATSNFSKSKRRKQQANEAQLRLSKSYSNGLSSKENSPPNQCLPTKDSKPESKCVMSVDRNGIRRRTAGNDQSSSKKVATFSEKLAFSSNDLNSVLCKSLRSDSSESQTISNKLESEDDAYFLDENQTSTTTTNLTTSANSSSSFLTPVLNSNEPSPSTLHSPPQKSDKNYLYDYEDNDYGEYDDDDDDDDEDQVNDFDDEIDPSTDDISKNLNRLDESSGTDVHKSGSKLNLNANENLNVVDLKSNIKLNKPFNKVKSNKQVSLATSAEKQKISCLIWQGNEWKGADLSMLEICNFIVTNVEKTPLSLDYFYIGVIFSFIISVFPFLYQNNATLDKPSLFGSSNSTFQQDKGKQDLFPKGHHFIIDLILLMMPFKNYAFALFEKTKFWTTINITTAYVLMNTFFSTLFLCILYFSLLSIAERTLVQRFLHAKYFCYLTSNRRARKHTLPHFRLGRVENIKTWLSVRSYMKRRGPQRSIDAIISSTFLIGVGLCSIVCIRFLQEPEFLSENLLNWKLVIWCLCIWTFMLRFMTIGFRINKKYRNCMSMVITEQINLYLQVEKKPEKKEELTVVNNVLKLAADLLKEIENPFKISGLGINPWVYNVTKVVILSASSAVLSELFGFKLKLYKIKMG